MTANLGHECGRQEEFENEHLASSVQRSWSALDAIVVGPASLTDARRGEHARAGVQV